MSPGRRSATGTLPAGVDWLPLYRGNATPAPANA